MTPPYTWLFGATADELKPQLRAAICELNPLVPGASCDLNPIYQNVDGFSDSWPTHTSRIPRNRRNRVWNASPSSLGRLRITLEFN